MPPSSTSPGTWRPGSKPHRHLLAAVRRSTARRHGTFEHLQDRQRLPEAGFGRSSSARPKTALRHLCSQTLEAARAIRCPGLTGRDKLGASQTIVGSSARPNRKPPNGSSQATALPALDERALSARLVLHRSLSTKTMGSSISEVELLLFLLSSVLLTLIRTVLQRTGGLAIRAIALRLMLSYGLAARTGRWNP